MSHEVFNIACEDEDSITEEEIKISLESATAYENQKLGVKGITSTFYLCY